MLKTLISMTELHVSYKLTPFKFPGTVRFLLTTTPQVRWREDIFAHLRTIIPIFNIILNWLKYLLYSRVCFISFRSKWQIFMIQVIFVGVSVNMFSVL